MGIIKRQDFGGNFGRDESTFGWVRSRVGRRGPTKEEKDIMFGGSGGDWVLWRSKGRGSFTHITEGDAEVLVIYKT